MAEVGLIASIVGVAAAGAKTSITLFQIANAIGSAAYEVRFVAADMSALSLVLTNLSNTLQARKAVENEGDQITGAVLLLCRSVINDSNELVTHLNPLIEGTGTATKNLIPNRDSLPAKKSIAVPRSLYGLANTISRRQRGVWGEMESSRYPRNVYGV